MAFSGTAVSARARFLCWELRVQLAAEQRGGAVNQPRLTNVGAVSAATALQLWRCQKAAERSFVLLLRLLSLWRRAAEGLCCGGFGQRIRHLDSPEEQLVLQQMCWNRMKITPPATRRRRRRRTLSEEQGRRAHDPRAGGHLRRVQQRRRALGEELPPLAGCSRAAAILVEVRDVPSSLLIGPLLALKLPRYPRLPRHHQEALQRPSNASPVLERLALLSNHSFFSHLNNSSEVGQSGCRRRSFLLGSSEHFLSHDPGVS